MSGSPQATSTPAWFVGTIWAITRAVNLAMVAMNPTALGADIPYYGAQIDAHAGIAARLIEYPAPVVWLLQGFHALTGALSDVGQIWAFVAVMVALDAAVAVAVGRRSTRGAMYWTMFLALCGPIVWVRFDLVATACVALACLWLATNSRVAGALAGIGAAVKLWPALLVLPLAAPGIVRRGSAARRRLFGFVVAGGLLGLASLVGAGWARSASPLAWQSARGLEIESVWASVPVILRALGVPGYDAWDAPSNSVEVAGPGVSTWLAVSTVATVALVLGVCVLAYRLWRCSLARPVAPEAIVLVVLVSVAGFIVANKVLSTQYVVWLAGPLAALVAFGYRHRLLAGLGYATAFFTQLILPWTFRALARDAELMPALVLVTRNLLLVALTAVAAVLGWRATRRSNDVGVASPLVGSDVSESFHGV